MKFYEKIVYGSARFATSLVLSVFSLATVYMYSFIFGLDPVLNGLALFIAKILMGIAGPIVGFVSDRRPLIPRLGYRKSYILIGSLLLSGSFALLYSPFVFIDMSNQLYLFIYETFFVTLFSIMYVFVVTPYQALLPEISLPEERTEISTYENLFNGIGGVIGMGFSFFLPLISGNLHFILYIIQIFSVITVVQFLLVFFIIKEKKIEKTVSLTLDDLKLMAKDHNFIFWLVVDGVLGIGFTFFTALVVPILSVLFSVMDVSLEKLATNTSKIFQILPILLILMLSGILGYILTVIVSKRYTLKKTVIYLSTPTIVLASFTVIIHVDAIVSIVLFIAGTVFGFVVYNIIRYTALANVINISEGILGKKVAGLYTGLEGVLLNFLQALAYLEIGFLLKYLGDKYYIITGPIIVIHVLVAVYILNKKVKIDVNSAFI